MAADPNNSGPTLEGIDSDRYAIYKDAIVKSLTSKDGSVTKVVSTALSNESDEKSTNVDLGEATEKIEVTTSDGKTQEIQLTCNICYDDEFAPSQLIEYSFNDKDYYLSSVCLTCLTYYKEKKFSLWKEHIEKPVCEASFKRLLKIGVITTMFDHLAFASPEHEKEQYEVKDDNGKTVPIPRPVSSLRMFDAINEKYIEIDSHLKGAPETEEEKNKLWQTMIESFNTKYGKVMIDQWLGQK